MKHKKDPEDGSNSLFSLLREASGTDELVPAHESGAQTDAEVSPVVAQRRREILEAALNIFSKKGFEGSRTREIAAEAGVSEATVFKYFPTKRNLMLSIMEPVIESVAKPLFLAPITKIIDKAAEYGLERTLVILMKDRVAVFLKNERLVRTLLLELGRQEEMLSIFRELILPLIQQEIRRLFEGAQGRGEIAASIDANVFTRNLLSIVIGNIALMKGAPEQFALRPIDREIEDTVSIFVHGIQGGIK